MNNPNIEAALHLVNGNWSKYVPALSYTVIHADILIGFRRFNNSIRCKEFWLKHEEENETYSEGVMGEDKFDEEGLSTKSRPRSKSEMQNSEQLQKYLTQLERELLSIELDTEIIENKDKDQEMRRQLQRLEESEIVTLPNDKTKRFRSMKN